MGSGRPSGSAGGDLAIALCQQALLVASYLAEILNQQGAREVVATCDPGNRSFRVYINEGPKY
jgi:hypothetical protein